MNLPKEITDLISKYNLVEITDFHVSGDKVYNIGNKFILKVSNDVNRLSDEWMKDLWFSKYLFNIKPIKFIILDDVAYYLREYIDGCNLCDERYLSNPILLIKLLREALEILDSIPKEDCPFIVGDGNAIIHGDFCLPNILVSKDKVVGFIDLSCAGIGDKWCDYAWCIWSLEYNLKTNEFTPLLLKELGIEFDIEKFNKYTKD